MDTAKTQNTRIATGSQSSLALSCRTHFPPTLKPSLTPAASATLFSFSESFFLSRTLCK